MPVGSIGPGGPRGSAAVLPPVLGVVQGWQTLLGGGLNSGDGWVAVSPAAIITNAPYEGDRCGALRGTDTGFPPFTPFGSFRRDYSPVLDLSAFTKFRYRRKYVNIGDNSTLTVEIRFYSTSLTLVSSFVVAYTSGTSSLWTLNAELTIGVGGAANWAAIERVEFQITNITGGGFAPPSELHVDLLEIFRP